MIPEGAMLSEEDIELVEEPTLTYGLDLENKRILSTLTGLDAMRLFVTKALLTIRYKHVIYSDDTGSEADTLRGQNRLYVQSELERMVKEALLVDDRIESVTEFKYTYDGSDLLAEFKVTTIFGDFDTQIPEVINVV